MSDSLVVMQGGKEHSEARQKVLDLRNKVEESYWELSKTLNEVYQGSYYIPWGYSSWKEYVESELQFALRKAQYLVSIQDWFGKMKPEVKAWVQGLGWTKAKELIGIVTDDNAADWKARLEGLTYAEMVAELKGGKGGDETPIDGQAERPTAPEKPGKKAFALFPEQATNVEAALAKAKSLANTDKEGHALDLICSDFLATNAADDDLFGVLRRLEKSSGLRLVAYDKEADAVVFGADLLDEIAGDAE
jgi:hypothetical protein